MAQAVRGDVPGLRELKKRRTRERLIGAGAELCVKQGYENTTVEQIAAAADVSPRTFSRYFATKESVIAATAEEIDEAVTGAFIRQPDNITAHEALLRAHLETFTGSRGLFTRMAVLIEIVNTSPALSAGAFGFKPAFAETALARRLGVPLDHPAVALLTGSWTVLFASAFSGLGTPGNDPIEPHIVCERLTKTYRLFTTLWSAGPTGSRPPAGEPHQ